MVGAWGGIFPFAIGIPLICKCVYPGRGYLYVSYITLIDYMMCSWVY